MIKKKIHVSRNCEKLHAVMSSDWLNIFCAVVRYIFWPILTQHFQLLEGMCEKKNLARQTSD